jgi:hypothetical protein
MLLGLELSPDGGPAIRTHVCLLKVSFICFKLHLGIPTFYLHLETYIKSLLLWVVANSLFLLGE